MAAALRDRFLDDNNHLNESQRVLSATLRSVFERGVIDQATHGTTQVTSVRTPIIAGEPNKLGAPTGNPA
jgi:hypothetical protein